MNLQARIVPPAHVNEAQAKVRQFDQDLRDLRDQLRRAEASFTNARNREMLFSGGTELQVTSLDQREEMMRTTDQFSKNNARLQDSERILNDTIDTGIGILDELEQQGTQIRGMRERMKDIGLDVEQANRVLRKMVWVMYQNKVCRSVFPRVDGWILFYFIFIYLILFLFLCYFILLFIFLFFSHTLILRSSFFLWPFL